MGDDAQLERRQIWARPTTTTPTPGCTPFLLPSNGVLNINRSYAITLTENAVFQPTCTGNSSSSRGYPPAVMEQRDPFYSSTSPQLYAIGCATVVSYLLVIILLITPRTFFVGGPGGGTNFLGRHGMISGSYSGSSSVVGVGGRPWLQKVAALTVAISLTIATADSFKVAEKQYDSGYMDAEALTDEVIDGLEIRIVRVISSTFLWLAQVQTLIRLFPRHKEKVMIKWAGFALIVLDTIFSILNNFVAHGTNTRPRLFDDAIPALSYLFELALSLLYAAWVIFYSLSKHRFAFFHPKMRNICLVALLSLCAVLVPVVFFVLDISKPNVAGWGEYIRWVGAAAASVVVWEWVERIEALERDERKDGILGREIFDGDEMLEVTPSEEVDWPHGQEGGGGGGTGTSTGWGGVMGLGHRPLRTRVGFQRGGRGRRGNQIDQGDGFPAESQNRGATHPTPPPAAVTPTSRADTTSAASTVYYVRYHPVSSPSPPVVNVPMPPMREEGEKEATVVEESHGSSGTGNGPAAHENVEPSVPIKRPESRWFSLVNPFRRRRASPPREVATAQAVEEQASMAKEPDESEEKDGRWNFMSRVDNLLSLHKERDTTGPGADVPLPVTVIPARGRGQQTWSPRGFEASDPLARSQSPHASPNRSGLPVRVIPPRPRSVAPWPRPATNSDAGNRDHGLQYDPDAAALVGLEPDHSPSERRLETGAQDGSLARTFSSNETVVGSDDQMLDGVPGDGGDDGMPDFSSRTSSEESYRQRTLSWSSPVRQQESNHSSSTIVGGTSNGSMSRRPSQRLSEVHEHDEHSTAAHADTDLEAGLGPRRRPRGP
ncbi:hypothetical protein VTN02DRAFT_1638 [Thermoascus thermophilus]